MMFNQRFSIIFSTRRLYKFDESDQYSFIFKVTLYLVTMYFEVLRLIE